MSAPKSRQFVCTFIQGNKGRRRLRNEKLYDLHSSRNITLVIKLRKIK